MIQQKKGETKIYMNKLKKNNLDNAIEFMIVGLCIFCSGAVAYQNNNKMILLIFIALMFFILLLKKKKITLKLNGYILFFITFYIIASIYHLIKNDTSFFGEMGILAQFILSILICILVSPKNFIDKYNKIVYFLGISSIIMYTIPLFFPKFTSFFPVIQDYVGSKFYNAGLYCYPTYIVKHYYRNQSIFWECGAFQAFLNIALFLELYVLKNKNKKHILIYILTILTTQSTTGYIILILLVVVKIIQMVKKNKKNLKFMVLLISCIIPFIPLFSSVIIQKFSYNSSSYFSFTRRYYDSIVDFKIIFDNIDYFLFGTGEENYIHIFSKLLNNIGIGTFAENSSSSNSLTAFTAQHGIVSAGLIFIIYIKGIFSVKRKTVKVIFFLIILICLATENFVMAPVFLTLMIQMVNYSKNDKEKIHE